MLRDWLKRLDEEMKTEKESDMKSYDATIIEQLRERRQEETPDFLSLKSKGFHPVFVYGTLKKGGCNHHLLREAPYLGEAETLAAGFVMAVCSSDFPIAMISPQARTRIAGQVFLADPKQMLMLDRLESNGTMYDRRKVRCILHDQEKSQRVQECFMYVGNKDYWGDARGLTYRPGFLGRDGKTCLSFNQLQKSGRPFDDPLPF